VITLFKSRGGRHRLRRRWRKARDEHEGWNIAQLRAVRVRHEETLRVVHARRRALAELAR
jgi:hypothetical protein